MANKLATQLFRPAALDGAAAKQPRRGPVGAMECVKFALMAAVTAATFSGKSPGIMGFRAGLWQATLHDSLTLAADKAMKNREGWATPGDDYFRESPSCASSSCVSSSFNTTLSFHELPGHMRSAAGAPASGGGSGGGGGDSGGGSQGLSCPVQGCTWAATNAFARRLKYHWSSCHEARLGDFADFDPSDPEPQPPACAECESVDGDTDWVSKIVATAIDGCSDLKFGSFEKQATVQRCKDWSVQVEQPPPFPPSSPLPAPLLSPPPRMHARTLTHNHSSP